MEFKDKLLLISIFNIGMYDVAIIGGGPAGLTAAIYAQRYSFTSLVFTDKEGGLIIENPFIENYPGFEKIDGFELGKKMMNQAKSLGTKLIREKIKVVEKKGKTFVLKSEWGNEVEAKTVIIAHGLKRRKLEVKNEEKFIGKGVSYCTTCDGAFFKDKIVAVVGGGNSAGVSALLLSKISKKVYLIYRKEKFSKMQEAYIKKIESTKNIEVMFNENVIECIGDKNLEKIKIKSGKEIEIDGLFIEIGFSPEIPFETNFKIDLDERGFIKVDRGMHTNEKGVFAAGDITTGSNYFHQIVTATSEGAIAAESVHKFCLKN